MEIFCQIHRPKMRKSVFRGANCQKCLKLILFCFSPQLQHNTLKKRDLYKIPIPSYLLPTPNYSPENAINNTWLNYFTLLISLMSFLTGVYLDLLKMVKVIPIQKGGSSRHNHYRPISLLSTGLGNFFSGVKRK